MKIVNSALTLFLAGTASAKLNAPEDRKLQFDGMEMPDFDGMEMPEGAAEAIAAAEAAAAEAQEAIGDLQFDGTEMPEGAEAAIAAAEAAAADAQEAIGDLLGNASFPEGTSFLPGDLNGTTFLPGDLGGILNGTTFLPGDLGGMMNGTTFLPGDLNGTLGGFMPEGGLGLEIPEGDFTQNTCPETCPQPICDSIDMSSEGSTPDEAEQEALKEAMAEACEAGSIGDCFGANLFAFVCEMQCAEGVDPSQFGITAEDIESTCSICKLIECCDGSNTFESCGGFDMIPTDSATPETLPAETSATEAAAATTVEVEATTTEEEMEPHDDHTGHDHGNEEATTTEEEMEAHDDHDGDDHGGEEAEVDSIETGSSAHVKMMSACASVFSVALIFNAL